MHEDATIAVVIDGLAESVPAGTSLGRLLRDRGEPLKVAMIEHNGALVAPARLDEVVLEDGDRVEVILPAFGG